MGQLDPAQTVAQPSLARGLAQPSTALQKLFQWAVLGRPLASLGTSRDFSQVGTGLGRLNYRPSRAFYTPTPISQ